MENKEIAELETNFYKSGTTNKRNRQNKKLNLPKKQEQREEKIAE